MNYFVVPRNLGANLAVNPFHLAGIDFGGRQQLVAIPKQFEQIFAWCSRWKSFVAAVIRAVGGELGLEIENSRALGSKVARVKRLDWKS
jgi:hypothetical protein